VNVVIMKCYWNLIGRTTSLRSGSALLAGAADALKIIEPSADHGVLIGELTDQQLVLSKLESWLGFEIDN